LGCDPDFDALRAEREVAIIIVFYSKVSGMQGIKYAVYVFGTDGLAFVIRPLTPRWSYHGANSIPPSYLMKSVKPLTLHIPNGTLTEAARHLLIIPSEVDKSLSGFFSKWDEKKYFPQTDR
jgi:hypothetical protein